MNRVIANYRFTFFPLAMDFLYVEQLHQEVPILIVGDMAQYRCQQTSCIGNISPVEFYSSSSSPFIVLFSVQQPKLALISAWLTVAQIKHGTNTSLGVETEIFCIPVSYLTDNQCISITFFQVNCLRQEIADAGVESAQLRSKLTCVREELVKKNL